MVDDPIIARPGADVIMAAISDYGIVSCMTMNVIILGRPDEGVIARSS